jgi:hypothetical protein
MLKCCVCALRALLLLIWMLQYVGFRMTTSSGTARRRFAPATWCLLAASGLRFHAGPFLGSLLQARPRSPKNLPAEAVGQAIVLLQTPSQTFPPLFFHSLHNFIHDSFSFHNHHIFISFSSSQWVSAICFKSLASRVRHHQC